MHSIYYRSDQHGRHIRGCTPQTDLQRGLLRNGLSANIYAILVRPHRRAVYED
jgi:hypothetical protein